MFNLKLLGLFHITSISLSSQKDEGSANYNKQLSLAQSIIVVFTTFQKQIESFAIGQILLGIVILILLDRNESKHG